MIVLGIIIGSKKYEVGASENREVWKEVARGQVRG